MPGWNFAEIWEVVAEQIPDAPAQIPNTRPRSSTSARYILDHYHNGESPNIPDTPKEMRRDMKWMKPLEARAASKPATPFRTAGIALDLAGLGLGAAALAYGKRRQSSPAV